MPIATIQVAAVTAPDLWTLGAGADKVIAVNAPHDDDTSYIRASGAAGTREQYSLGTHVIPTGSTIQSVSTMARVRAESSVRSFRTVLVLGANSSFGGPHAEGTSYSSRTDVISRPGGGSWAFSDLNSLQIGIELVATPTVARRCTSLWLIVDYTPPGMMFQLFR